MIAIDWGEGSNDVVHQKGTIVYSYLDRTIYAVDGSGVERYSQPWGYSRDYVLGRATHGAEKVKLYTTEVKVVFSGN